MNFKTLVFYFLTFFCSSGFAQPKIQIIETQTQSSFRGLSVVDDLVAWISGSQGTIGRTKDGGKTWQFFSIPGFEKSDFRTLYAFDSLRALVGNTGSPAVIFKTENGGKSWQEVYRNVYPEAFLDGIDFWDENQGMVYGDPIGRKMLILKTSNAGKTWIEAPENERPLLDSGEASFAASGTNIRLWDKNKVAIATGGRISRIWFSENKGQNWKTISVPILQGNDSQGIFSFSVDRKSWLLVGGDYKVDSLKKDHVFFSENEGNTWQFPKVPTGGYRECVEMIAWPKCISVGPNGVDFSEDGGKNWGAISNEKGFHVVRKARKGQLILMAGGKGKIGIAGRKSE
jgi:photosystem II stability/assembly factor-like uncharacterized protein